MSRRTRRAFQPRFFLFLLVTVFLVVGVILLVSTVSDYIKERKESSTLQLPVSATEEPGTETKNETALSAASGTAVEKQALNTSVTYSVTGNNKNGLSSEVRLNNEEKIYSSNPRSQNLSLLNNKAYTSLKGVTTFGGGAYRDSFSYGTATITLKTMESAWSMVIGKLGNVAGTGWTGQPLIVEWDASVLATLGVSDTYKAMEGFTEVIYPAADGNIYFYELTTGAQTRNPIAVGASLLGTATLDPSGAPMLYVGQGIMTKNDKGNSVSYLYAVNLITNSVVYEFGGRDYFARRSSWNAFDSSPLIIGDTLIAPAENGVIYFIKLNTSYDSAAGTVSINPGDRIKYRYTGAGYADSTNTADKWYGIESSASAFRNYLYVTDNGGMLQCIDMNTLSLLYAVNLGGDTDASPVIEEDGEKGTIFLYTVNQTCTQGADLPSGWGYCSVKKINGLTGDVIWDVPRICYVGDGSYKSGSRSTPHVGKSTVSDLLICSFSGAGIPVTDATGGVSYTYGGRIVAFNKETGDVVWSIESAGNGDYVSSPVVLYTDRGAAYLIACDRNGSVNLYDASTGGSSLCPAVALGSRIDSTPAAFGNYIVVGTTGKNADGSESTPRIWCLKIS